MSDSEKKIVDAEIKTGRSFSLIWLVPLLAVIIGGWLAYKSYRDHGPQITLHFESADGLVAGKTKIKFNALAVGSVEDIRLNQDLSGVEVIARLDSQMRPFLKSKSEFWVEKARIDAGTVSGLQTLLGGAYIAMNPSREGVKIREFIGLEKPPAIKNDVPGKRYQLNADDLGSLKVGSPVYYKKIRVGQVVDYHLDKAGHAVNIIFFIASPYDRLVKTSSRFWNSSGIEMRLDAQGIKVQTEALTSILFGGLSFETPVKLSEAEEALAGHHFRLYKNQTAANRKIYSEKLYLLMYFPQSVRGLTVGAPVDFGGLKIGSVVDVQMFFDVDNLQMKIPVLIALEPERLLVYSQGEMINSDEFTRLNSRYRKSAHPIIEALVDKGLRATLKTGNLLTGQLYIALEMDVDSPVAHLTYGENYPVFPTVAASLNEITENISRLVKKLNALPLKEMVVGVNGSLAELERTLASLRVTFESVDKSVVPQISTVLQHLDVTLTEISQTLGPQSGLSPKLQQTLDEVSSTVRSLRSLAESLDQKPESLIFGKGEK